MRFKTMRDVMDRVILFHKNLAKFYHNMSDVVQKERVKLLLDYMARHEEHLQENLARYKGEISTRLLDTWFKYVPSSNVLKDCEQQVIKPDMSVEEAVTQALKFDDCLLNFYNIMAENCCYKDLKEIFTNLANMEKRNRQNFVRDAQEVYDL